MKTEVATFTNTKLGGGGSPEENAKGKNLAKNLEEYRFEAIKQIVDLGAKASSLYLVIAVGMLTLCYRFSPSPAETLFFAQVGWAAGLVYFIVISGIVVAVARLSGEFAATVSPGLSIEEREVFLKSKTFVMFVGYVLYGAAIVTIIAIGLGLKLAVANSVAIAT